MAEEKKSKTTKAAPRPEKGGGKAGKGGEGATVSSRGAVTKERPAGPKDKPRLARHYNEQVRPALMQKFGYRNVMQVPRLVKIVLNMGVGDALVDAKVLDSAMNELGQITGQRPAIRRAKKSISNFKLRAGVPVGCSVTLRGSRMFEFYDRLVNVAVPRIRDFRGLNPRSFDGRGNYSMGFTEHTIFPELPHEKVARERGMDVTIVTSAKTDEEGRELLRLMSMPFRQK